MAAAIITLLMMAEAAAVIPPAKPALRKTFSANMTGYSFAPGTGNMTSNSQPIAVSEELQSILNLEINPDGRVVHVVFDYHNDSRAGIFSLQPFFGEHVCFIFPPQPVPSQYNPFEIGVEFLWFNQAWDPHVGLYYNQSKFNGTDTVAGQACDRWVYSVGECSATSCDEISWCVQRESGGLISVNRSVVTKVPGKGIYNQQLRNVFSGYTPTADTISFAVPSSGCADMRPITEGGTADDIDHDSQGQAVLLNDQARITAINDAAGGAWTAAPFAAWEGLRADDAAVTERFGLLSPIEHRPPAATADTTPLRPLNALRNLPLPSEAHIHERNAIVAAAGGLPVSFDLREKAPHCASIQAVRNQGACGGCCEYL